MPPKAQTAKGGSKGTSKPAPKSQTKPKGKGR